jgi:hypothetical protein
MQVAAWGAAKEYIRLIHPPRFAQSGCRNIRLWNAQASPDISGNPETYQLFFAGLLTACVQGRLPSTRDPLLTSYEPLKGYIR